MKNKLHLNTKKVFRYFYLNSNTYFSRLAVGWISNKPPTNYNFDSANCFYGDDNFKMGCLYSQTRIQRKHKTDGKFQKLRTATFFRLNRFGGRFIHWIGCKCYFVMKDLKTTLTYVISTVIDCCEMSTNTPFTKKKS